MNYQNNMGVYYTYNQNKNKNKEAQRKRRNILISLLLLLLVLLFGWIYFNYFKGNTFNNFFSNKAEINTTKENLTNTIATPNDTHAKESTIETPISNIVKTEGNSKNNLNVKANIPSTKTTEVNNTTLPSTSLEINHTKENALVNNVKALIPGHKELNSSLNSISNTTKTMVHEINTTVNNALVSNKSSEQNSSTQSILKTTNTETQEVNSSQKAITQNKLPEDLYHLYIVSPGETITSIAISQYNDETMSLEIIKANPDLENPNSIKEGQEILLPINDESKSYKDILHFK